MTFVCERGTLGQDTEKRKEAYHMENGTVFTIKPTKETRFYRLIEFLHVAFYRDGVLLESQIKRKIGEKLGLLLYLVEELPAGWRLLKMGYRRRKKALQTITREEWEDAREERRQEREEGEV